MKLLSRLLVILLAATSLTAVADSDVEQGAKLYKTYCSACHGVTGGMDMSKRVAPPVIAVKMHYIGVYADKDSFVAAVTDWLEKPDASNSMMPGAVRKFKLMPKIPVAKDDAKKIAAYIYEGKLDKPAGFDAHFEEMHGKGRGMGRGGM